jgi:hypothetical protein
MRWVLLDRFLSATGPAVLLQEVVPAVAEKYPAVPESARHFLECAKGVTSQVRSDRCAFRVHQMTDRIAIPAASLRVSANLFDTGVRPALGRTLRQKKNRMPAPCQ